MSERIKAEMVRGKYGDWVIPWQEGRDDLPRVFKRGKAHLDEWGEPIWYDDIQIPAVIDLAVTDWPEHVTGPLPIELQPLGYEAGYGTWIVFYEDKQFGKVRGR